MRFDTSADEARTRGEDEVAAEPFPDEMKIVAGVPHVLTRARDQIRLLLRVVRRGPSSSADIGVRGKDAERTLRAEETQQQRASSRQSAVPPVPC